MTQEDVKRHADLAWPVVGRSKAHAFLAEWRTANAQWTLDLTDRPDLFEWRSYLARHPDRAMFWTDGRRLRKFAISRIDSVMDNNTHEPRVDFLLLFTDQTVIRLHPGSKNETRPVLTTAETVPQTFEGGRHDAVAPSAPRGKGGAAAGGAGEGKGKDKGKGKGKAGGKKGALGKAGGKGNVAAAPAPPRGNATEPPTARLHFTGVSQADLVPTRAVKEWLDERFRESQQPGGRVFRLDVTEATAVDGWRTPKFLWFLWFNNVATLAHLVPWVVEVWLVVVDGGPGVWFTTLYGEYAVKFQRFNAVVEDDMAVLDRQINWEA